MTNETIKGIVDNAKRSFRVEDGDYIQDGLTFCGKCKTPKEAVITLLGQKMKVPCLCRCKNDEYEQERKAEKEIQRQIKINQLRINSLQDKSLLSCEFAKAEMTKQLEAVMRYANKWEEMLKRNIGLLLWGNTGTGKTFAAGCVANELISKGVPVLMTSFPKLLMGITGQAWESKEDYIKSLSAYKLLIIDDLGVERESSFAMEQVYNVIDDRYKLNLPLIITTNLTIDEIRNAKNIDCQRIYDRILEMCIPINFAGESKRKQAAKDKLEEARRILNGD